MTPSDAIVESGAQPSIWQQSVGTVFYRALGLFGKDLVSMIKIPAFFLVITAGLPVVLVSIETMTGVQFGNDLTSFHAEYFQGMLLIAAAVIGLSLSVDEEDSGTREFLLRLPGSPWRHAASKLLVGIIFVAVYALLAYAAYVAFPRGTVYPDPNPFLGEPVGIYPGFAEVEPRWLVLAKYPVLLLACLLTALAAGALTGGLASAAIVGVLAFSAYRQVADMLFGIQSMGSSSRNVYPVIYLTVWSAIMFGALTRLYARSRADMPGLVPGALLDMRLWSARKGTFSNPARHTLFWPTVASMAAVGVNLFVEIVSDKNEDAAIMAAPILSAFLGASVWEQSQRNLGRALVFTLPVSRKRVFFNRLSQLIMPLVLLIPCYIATIWLIMQGKGHLDDQNQFLAISAGYSLIMVCCALFGCALNLFYRVRIAATVLALLITVFWVAPVFGGIGNLIEVYGVVSFPVIVFTVWSLIILIGTPVLLGYVAYCHSPLLELSEARRSGVGLILIVALTAWGMLLLRASPLDMFHLIFG